MRAALEYHNGTKHPRGYLMDPRHRYDPRFNPIPFKIYRGIEALPLPRPADRLDVPALSSISAESADPVGDAALDIEDLYRVLHYSAGITKTFRYPWGEIPFRAAACTGALFHIELYVVCRDLEGLDAGVYHYDPRASSLDLLRKGDHRSVLVNATAGEPAVSSAPAIIVYTDVFWRNAIKYQAREYRHAFWDAGTIIANTLAMTSALELPTRVAAGFVDETVNRLLDLDSRKEAAIALVTLGRESGPPAPSSPPIDPLGFEIVPVSDFEREFPAIQEMHAASSLSTPDEVAAWRASRLSPDAAEQREMHLIGLDLPSGESAEQAPIERVIARRGSTRVFRRAPISFAEVSTILSTTTGEVHSDYRLPNEPLLNQPYLISNVVDGLDPGTYAFHREQGALEPLRGGDFRNEAGRLGLGQALPADASLNVYFMTDLEGVLDAYGDRGYRIAQLEASITAGRMYLAAYALGLGATGLTFFDDEVAEFFSPHAAGKSVMFLIAIGHPRPRGRP